MTPKPTDLVTCEAPVFFSSTEGQTALIAIRLATILHEHGLESRAIDMSMADAQTIDWTRVRGVLVGASIHAGRHQRAARVFVHAHAPELNLVPSAFFSVSLSAASKNPEEVEAAERIAKAFPAAHGWNPQRIVSVAGRLAYLEYGVFTRMIIKWIARKEGAPTDTNRDYELTNWDLVDALGHEMAACILERTAAVA